MKKNKNFISKMYVWPAVYDEMNLPDKGAHVLVQ